MRPLDIDFLICNRYWFTNMEYFVHAHSMRLLARIRVFEQFVCLNRIYPVIWLDTLIKHNILNTYYSRGKLRPNPSNIRSSLSVQLVPFPILTFTFLHLPISYDTLPFASFLLFSICSKGFGLSQDVRSVVVVFFVFLSYAGIRQRINSHIHVWVIPLKSERELFTDLTT